MSTEKLAEQLFTIGPLIHKKLNKGMPIGGIPKQQLALLFCISEENGKTMKHYGNKMMISKSNVTILADKLIEEKLIERELVPNDRRVVLLTITEKGREYLGQQKIKFKQALIKKLEILDSQDVDTLIDLFERIRVVFDKIKT